MINFINLPSDMHYEINQHLPQPQTIEDIQELTNLALVSKNFSSSIYCHQPVTKIPAVQNLFNDKFPDKISIQSILATYKEQLKLCPKNFDFTNKELIEMLDKLYIPVGGQIDKLTSINFNDNNTDISKEHMVNLIILSGSQLTKEQFTKISNFITDIDKLEALTAFCTTKEGGGYLAKNWETIININDTNKIAGLSDFCETIKGTEFLNQHRDTIMNINNPKKIMVLSEFFSTKEGAEYLVKNLTELINMNDIEELQVLVDSFSNNELISNE